MYRLSRLMPTRRASWLMFWEQAMVPSACGTAIAGRLRRLADTIDEVVAGQLWIQICDHDPENGSYVAKKILDRVYRESMAEFGVGDLAKRRDKAWSATINSGRLSAADRDLLMDLAYVAERIDAPGRRGRGGLMTPLVTQMVEGPHAMASRTIRRRAASAIERSGRLPVLEGW